ncbi:fucolectin-like isoform X2 [Larimichthys crocea]|uniref:fucolectin-like isoform X2 n=1 Tax=Larimichthys crocea TaxID=215358 RepID=UPI000F5E6E5F|nr:fucolectin-like isoform X2 [Larimichthys crocea]
MYVKSTGGSLFIESSVHEESARSLRISRMMNLCVFLVLLLLGTCSASPYENLALRGKATQSDRYDHAFAAAYNAIDGNRDSNFHDGSCTHTSGKSDPWWRVDLLDSYIITSITIYNRGDCCQERINGLRIHIGNSLDNNGLNNPLVGQIVDLHGKPTFTKTFSPHVKGRYVTLLLPGSNKYLTLCEVEVNGYRAKTDGKVSSSHQPDAGEIT